MNARKHRQHKQAKETDQAWAKKACSPVRGLRRNPPRILRLPVYRADLNHPVNIAEHGNAASPARPRDRADLTVRRVGGRSLGRTEEAKASGNARDRPTSVWFEMAREPVEPPISPGKQMTTAARRLMRPGAVASKEHSVARLPVSIAKLSDRDWSQLRQRVGQGPGRPYEDLSRMRGNSQVRF